MKADFVKFNTPQEVADFVNRIGRDRLIGINWMGEVFVVWFYYAASPPHTNGR